MKKTIKLLLALLVINMLVSCGNSNTEVIVAKEIEEVVSSRNIIVSEISGTAIVTHSDGQKLDAYEGMSLIDGDDVVVEKKSKIVLSIDSDKHIFADENTHFWLTATGSENNTKTIIYLEEGSVLCDIKEKLKDNEIFDVQTITSTMCVRGTVFRVCLMKGKDNSMFDLVEVYDGKVWSNIEGSNDNVTLEPGQCALIRKIDSADEVAKYVLAEDIDKNFIKETGLEISLDKADNAEEGVLKVSLDNASSEVLSRLETIIEEGTTLIIDEKEIKEAKKNVEENVNTSKKNTNTEKKEEVKTENKTQEKKEDVDKQPKPASTNQEKPCSHPNLIERVLVEPDCCHQKVSEITCPDCSYKDIVNGDYDRNKHVGEQTTFSSASYYCSPEGLETYTFCNSCHAKYNSTTIKKDHTDENGDGYCDYCQKSMSN